MSTTLSRQLKALSHLLATDPDVSQLNQGHLLALAFVCAAEEPVSLQQIATEVCITPSAASRMIVKLEEKGLVDRPAHRRPGLLTPTAKGREVNDRVQFFLAS